MPLSSPLYISLLENESLIFSFCKKPFHLTKVKGITTDGNLIRTTVRHRILAGQIPLITGCHTVQMTT